MLLSTLVCYAHAAGITNYNTGVGGQKNTGSIMSDVDTSQLQDPEFIEDQKGMDLDDPVEVQLGYITCLATGFQGGICRDVWKVCLKQKAILLEMIKKGKSYRPWLCEDGRFIKEFL